MMLAGLLDKNKTDLEKYVAFLLNNSNFLENGSRKKRIHSQKHQNSEYLFWYTFNQILSGSSGEILQNITNEHRRERYVPCFWMGRYSVIKLFFIFNLVSHCNYNALTGFVLFCFCYLISWYWIYMEKQSFKNIQHYLKRRRNDMGRFSLPMIKVTVIEINW